MKTIASFLLSIICAFGFTHAALAQSYEHITDWTVKAKLTENRLLTITEEISYDFGGLERHGIYRVIPERYDRNGAKYRYRYEVGDTFVDGKLVEKKVTREGDSMRIRLGNPEITIFGRHVYSITYTTDRAINDFPEDGVRELYWNVTGNEWGIPIQKASFTLLGPGSPSDLICFTGVYGSEEHNCVIEAHTNTVTASTLSSDNPDEPDLPAFQGFTVAIRYPEELIAPESTRTKVMHFITDNGWVFLPLFVLIIMYAIWYFKGRDPKGRGTVIAQFEEPKGLTPIEMSALMRQHISNQAVAATILDFGRRGYLKIKFSGDPADKPSWGKKVKFSLEKSRDADNNMVDFEKRFFSALFPGGSETLDISKVNSSVASAVVSLKAQVFKALEAKGLFGKNPSTVRALWMGVGFMFLFFSIYIIAISGVLSAVAVFLSAIIISVFGWFMPRITRAGAVVREEIGGFKLFLSVTETDRIKFHNAPETRPEQFERFLPAAVAFEVEDQWAKHFENLMVQPPSYFVGNTAGWNAMDIMRTSSAFSSQASGSAFRAPSSSGSGGSGFSGGGSGGGGGGGGGGSW